ncbi:hypothetical protein CTEN210_03520 [Chaetoceros tenuissimus]|uniref:Leucine-rich repeat domain-containing protein n=1 Tax=Chaetoceros tenuissimus TaxID=426638 RepID=A0AAD3H1M3_9STRA|nr:hypothetical protein CTEN210_03520 [Chaetoceros tenuissimus]
MRVQTEEWRRFIPGIRMYKGKKTYFYNGEILWDHDKKDFLVYDEKERHSWEVVIILPGVEIIPVATFFECYNVKTVILADTVRRIESISAFNACFGLVSVRLSRNLEYIGAWAFHRCESLTSISIPPSCRDIRNDAFHGCQKLIILGLPQHVQLGTGVFQQTALIRKSSIEIEDDEEEAVQWVKSINNEEEYALHRACASFNPLAEIIHALVKQQGIESMRMPNTIGITPSQYLHANTVADISEKEIVNKYILDMMGEIA